MMNVSWTQFNAADFAILSIILASALISLMRGFMREALSLATWIIAAWIAIRFSSTFADIFIAYISSESMRVVVAFAILFVATILIGGLFNFLVTQLIESTGLTGTDRVLGLVFGVLRGILLVGVLVMLGDILQYKKETWWTSSQLIPHFQELATWLQGFLPDQLNQFKSFNNNAS